MNVSEPSSGAGVGGRGIRCSEENPLVPPWAAMSPPGRWLRRSAAIELRRRRWASVASCGEYANPSLTIPVVLAPVDALSAHRLVREWRNIFRDKVRRLF